MLIVQAFGDPCCNCGSRQIVVEPKHLIGACAQCAPAVLIERSWSERLAKAGRTSVAEPRVQQSRAIVAQVHWNGAAPSRPRPLFGRLPRRQGNNPSPGAKPKPCEQLSLPGF